MFEMTIRILHHAMIATEGETLALQPRLERAAAACSDNAIESLDMRCNWLRDDAPPPPVQEMSRRLGCCDVEKLRNC